MPKSSLKQIVRFYLTTTVSRILENKNEILGHEQRFIRRDGSLFWGSYNVRVRRDEKGDVKFYEGFFSDITNRKLEQEILLKTKFAMDRAPDNVLWVDKNGYIIYASNSSCNSLGYSRDELLKMKIFEIDPDFLTENFEQHKKDLQRLGRMVFESRHRTKDGRIIPVEISTNAFFYNDEFFACAFDRDITERKRVEKALKQSEEQYRTLVNGIQDAVFRTDLDGTLVFASPSAAKILGCSSAEEMLGLVSADIYYDPEEAELHKQMIKERGKLTQYEATLKRRDNGDPVSVLASSQIYRNKDGEIAGFEGIYSDITERKRAEMALEEERRRLQQALREVRTLQGILPICVKCKKIRDDGGFWNQVEKYVTEHSDAEFSHGICPDCAKELYPEFYKDK